MRKEKTGLQLQTTK